MAMWSILDECAVLGVTLELFSISFLVPDLSIFFDRVNSVFQPINFAISSIDLSACSDEIEYLNCDRKS